MKRSVAMKMGIREGVKAFLVEAPTDAVEAMELPELAMGKTLRGEFAYIHCFAVTEAALREQFHRLKPHLAAGGMLWISWPKGKQLGSDLNLKKVIAAGYDHGLVESICLRVNEVWAGLKFTHPKPGKEYHNSYGKLPE